MTLPDLIQRLHRTARDLRGDRRGVSIIEFAFALPFMVLLYVGGYQLMDGISAYRKVTTATRTIADLTSRYETITNDQLQTILDASQQVLAPYSSQNARMTVTQVKVNGNGKGKVDWSKPSKNTSGLKANSKFSLPSKIAQPNTYLIVAEINYDYNPGVAKSILGSVTLSDRIIMSPRVTDRILLQ